MNETASRKIDYRESYWVQGDRKRSFLDMPDLNVVVFNDVILKIFVKFSVVQLKN